jgi:hypothetical protein
MRMIVTRKKPEANPVSHIDFQLSFVTELKNDPTCLLCNLSQVFENPQVKIGDKMKLVFVHEFMKKITNT